MEEHGFMNVSKLLHCGVYALLCRGEVVYVGKSTKPLVRIYSHVRNRGRKMTKGPAYGAPSTKGPAVNGKGIGFDGIWFLPCMLGQLDTLENYFIRKYLPRYNVKGKPSLAIPEDIRAILKQMITITGLPPLEDRPKVYIRRML